LRQFKIRLLEFDGTALEGQLSDLAGQVLGDALLEFKAGQMGPQCLFFQINRFAETAGGDVIAHDGVQFGKAVGQLGAPDARDNEVRIYS